MNRPRACDFALGARTTVWTASALAILTTLAWLGPHGVSWFAPLTALLFCRACFAAKRRVTAWRDWRAAWDEMAGNVPAEPDTRTAQDEPAKAAKTHSKTMRALLVAAALAVLAPFCSHAIETGSDAEVGRGFFCIVFGFIGLRFLRKRPGLVRTAPAPSAPSCESEHIVAQCLPVPKLAPTAHVRELLPNYCRALLAHAPGKARSDESA